MKNAYGSWKINSLGKSEFSISHENKFLCAVMEALSDFHKYQDLYRAMIKCGIPKEQAKEALLYCKNMMEEFEAEKKAS